jgi:hypothetical protein
MPLGPGIWEPGFRSFIFQVVQIALGILSCVLGGFFGIFWSSAPWRTGAPFWTGAVVSGAASTSFQRDRDIALITAFAAPPSMCCHRMLAVKKTLMVYADEKGTKAVAESAPWVPCLGLLPPSWLPLPMVNSS